MTYTPEDVARSDQRMKTLADRINADIVTRIFSAKGRLPSFASMKMMNGLETIVRTKIGVVVSNLLSYQDLVRFMSSFTPSCDFVYNIGDFDDGAAKRSELMAKLSARMPVLIHMSEKGSELRAFSGHLKEAGLFETVEKDMGILYIEEDDSAR